MRLKIIDMKGIGPQESYALRRAGFIYASQLAGITLKQLKGKVELPDEALDKIVTLGNLITVQELGIKYAYILAKKEIGIRNLKDLAASKPDDLLGKISELNKKQKMLHILPNIDRVKVWIEDAKAKN
jgi:hypothetical protein